MAQQGSSAQYCAESRHVHLVERAFVWKVNVASWPDRRFTLSPFHCPLPVRRALGVAIGRSALLAERTRNLARRGHRSVGISSFGFFLRDRLAACLVRRLTAIDVLERLVSAISRRVFWRGRTGIDRWMPPPFLRFLLRRFAVADACPMRHAYLLPVPQCMSCTSLQRHGLRAQNAPPWLETPSTLH